MVREMLDLLTDTSYDMKKLRRFIKNLDDCENVCTRRTKRMIEDDGLSMVSVSHGSTGSEYHGTLYVKNMISVLRKQIHTGVGVEEEY